MDQIKILLDRKELQLNSLLEITQAINNNVSEDSLYKIFNFTLRSNLNIQKLALFVLDRKWSCKINFGTRTDFRKLSLDELFKLVKKVHFLSELESTGKSLFNEFDIVIPISHHNETLAVVFIGGIDNLDQNINNDESVKFVQALSNIIIVAIENHKLSRQQLDQEAFRKELEIARNVQQFLFPTTLPRTDHLKIVASYLPHDLIGGDYYDYIPINRNQFLICVADVSGKGIPAALMMSNFQASLRTLLRSIPNLSEIMEALNTQVLDNTKGEKFITFFGAIYDISLKSLVYINCGHTPPILWDKKHGIRLLEDGTTVLGAMKPLPFIKEGFISDLDDFILFCYTDGLTETTNEMGEELGQQFLIDYITKNHFKDLNQIHEDIVVELDGFKGKNNYHDDITLLSCRVL